MTTVSKYVDTHSHLAMLEHAPQDEVVKRAKEAGVAYALSVSTRESDWEANEKTAGRFPNVYYALGVHPHHANEWNDCKPKLLAKFPKNKPPDRCLAIGEAGLDFHYNFSKRDEQIICYEDQLALAKAVNLPLIIHCRNSFPEVFAGVRKVGLGKGRAVMHCFTGNADQAKEAVSLGLWISFSGILTFPKADDLRAAARVIPEESLLLETDCPYLTPVPHRGKPNEPSYLPLTAAALAAVRGIDSAKMAERVYANSLQFLGLSGQ